MTAQRDFLTMNNADIQALVEHTHSSSRISNRMLNANKNSELRTTM